MSFAGEVRHLALHLIDLFEQNRIPYALMGGIVVPVWGIPRATYASTWCSRSPQGPRRHQNILAVQGLVDEDYLREWAARLGVESGLQAALDQAQLPPDESSPD